MTSSLKSATLNRKQAEYVARCVHPLAPHFELMYSGAIRAGKSVALLESLVLRANRPGAREGLCRLELKTLKETTLRTLLFGDGEMPPIIVPGTYVHHKTECVITFPKTGGQIVYFGLDDIQKSGSKSLSGCAVDEAAQLDETRWVWLSGRCSVKCDGIKPRIYGACNPDVPSHWIAKRFGLALTHTPLRTCKAIRTNTFDNAENLTTDYLAQINTFQGMMRRRFVLGEWCGSDDLVYEMWSRDAHFVDSFGPWRKALIGVDDASTLPFAAVLVLVDGDGRMHVAREVYSPGLTEVPKIEAVRSLADDSPAHVEAVIVDPAASGLKLALAKAGFPVCNGDNERLVGIRSLRSRLAPGPDGRPRFTVSPSCVHVAAEFESYERKEGSDEPVKENDHAMDALRYVSMHEAQPTAIVFDPAGLKTLLGRCTFDPFVTGKIEHEDGEGTQADRALAKQETGGILFTPSRKGTGPIRFWCEVNRKFKPSVENRYAMFCVPCDISGAPLTLVVVGDVVSRSIVADASLEMPHERAARVCAMLGHWFQGDGLPTLVGWWHQGAFGTTFQQAMKRVAYPRMWLGNPKTGEGWMPDKDEWNDAVGVLRVAWEGGKFHESDPAVFRQAGGYGWHNGMARPLAVADDPAKWATWGDLIIARAGLWRMLKTMEPPKIAAARTFEDVLANPKTEGSDLASM